MATNTQIARELGISVATVSRALTRPEMVAADTRERILAKARALGLKPEVKGKLPSADKLLGVIIAIIPSRRGS